MTEIADTPFATLSANGRLLRPVMMADTTVSGRFGYRGEISFDGPDDLLKEVFSTSDNGKSAIGFLAGSIASYESLPKIIETFGGALDADGKYFLYIADLPRGNRFLIPFGDIKIHAIFIDDTSVYNELIDSFYVDKAKLKKYSTAAKLDALADVGLKYAAAAEYAHISYDEGLQKKKAG